MHSIPNDIYEAAEIDGASRWAVFTKIELPKIAIGSSHSYFSRLTGGKWFVMTHGFDPEVLGAPKSEFIDEDRSEYHKYNINNYPDHKKIMEKVVSLGAKRHKQFELEVRAKEHHKINLSSLISISALKFTAPKFSLSRTSLSTLASND